MATAGVPDFTKADEFWIEVIQPRIAHIESVSPRDSKNLVDHARQALDDELDAMYRAMCHLRTRRNALSPISILPMELLARIFQFSAAAMPPSKSSKSNPMPARPLGWIYLTHICKHWRDVALHHPSLWANIDSRLLSDQWLRLLLARAKSTPISLSFPLLWSHHIPLIEKHLSHTQSLQFSTPYNILREAFQSFTSAPVLSSLELFAFPDIEGPESERRIILPGDIFLAQTSMLRRVQLHNITLSWSSLFLTNLTSLYVNYGWIDKMDLVFESDNPAHNSVSQYNHFFGALGRMPTLETLQLTSCLPQKSRGSFVHTHVTALSSLKTLGMYDMPAECFDIVKHLKVLSSCKLKLCCAGPGSRIRDLYPPVDGLYPFFEASYPSNETDEERPFRDLEISFPLYIWGAETVDITLWQTPDAPDSEYHCYPGKWDVTVRFPLPPPSVGPLEGLFRVLPLNALRFINVKVDHAGWSAHTWVSIFGRCRALEQVYVEGEPAMQFFEALILPVDIGGPDPSSSTLLKPDQLFLPSLKSVTISNVNFLTSVAHVDGDKPFIEYLVIWLQRRTDCIQSGGRSGADSGEVDGRLQKLCIVESTLLAIHVSQLQGLVQELEWDEDAVFREDEDEGDDSKY